MEPGPRSPIRSAASPREAFLLDLPARLETVADAAMLDAATSPPADAGMVRRLEPHLHRLPDASLVPSPLPRVVLTADLPVDARWLADAWAIEHPVAVSGDVHQHTWSVLAGGESLPDPSAARIAATRPRFGRFEVELVLARRPGGPLPGLVAGASPAYDLRELGGAITRIEVVPRDVD